MKRIKYAVYMNIPGECKGCSNKKWEYVTTTHDPVAYQKVFPMLNLKFVSTENPSEVKIIG